MTTPIKYRISSTATKPVSDTVKGAPLTSLEIDGNFRSIKDSIELIQSAYLPAGYSAPVEYVAGVILSSAAQTVAYQGEVYAPKAAEVPFTTSGTFEVTKFVQIQSVAGVDLVATGGSSLVGYLPGGTGAVATTVEAKLREAVSVKNFGAKGDWNGLTGTDDSIAIQLAIDSGAEKIDLCGKKYRIVTALNFASSNQKFMNGTFVFDGNQNIPLTSSDRIATITGDNVTFENVDFHGNHKQPYSSLVVVKNNTVGTKFLNCTFDDVYCSLNPAMQAILAQTSALTIEPYACTGFVLDNCTFSNLVKVNNGSLFPEVQGYGFIGGVYFLPEDRASFTSPQPVPSEGVINQCQFDTIKTLFTSQTNDDADAIRTYRHAGGTESLLVTITDCVFKACSKRAFKLRAAGSVVNGATVYGDRLANPMVAVIDAPQCTVRNVNFYSTAALPVETAIGAAYYSDNATPIASVYENIYISHCRALISIYGVDTSSDVKNLHFANIRTDSATIGISSGSPQPASYSNINFENISIACAGVDAYGVVATPDAAGNSNASFSNIKIENGSFEAYGSYLKVCGLNVKITDGAWLGRSTTAPLVRFGSSGQTGISVKNVSIEADGLNTGFLTATRTYLMYFAGNSADYQNVKLSVPEGISATYTHGQFLGNDWTLDGLTYKGAGWFDIGTAVASQRYVVKNAIRLGSDVCTSNFMRSDKSGTTNGVFQNITDFRPTTQPSILIGNSGSFVVSGVASNTSNANVVQHGGLAIVSSASKFGESSRSYTVSNPTTDRVLDVTADTLPQVAAVLGTVVADLKTFGIFR